VQQSCDCGEKENNMSNHVHNRLTVVKGSAEEVLKFISEQQGIREPSIYTTKLKAQVETPQEAERVNVTNASPSIGFDTLWVPLKQEQIQELLETFPEYEIIYHFSEEMGNFSDQEYHFVNGKQVKHTEFPNWRDELENSQVEAQEQAETNTIAF
jgi:hypothetical protein